MLCKAILKSNLYVLKHNRGIQHDYLEDISRDYFHTFKASHFVRCNEKHLFLGSHYPNFGFRSQLSASETMLAARCDAALSKPEVRALESCASGNVKVTVQMFHT